MNAMRRIRKPGQILAQLNRDGSGLAHHFHLKEAAAEYGGKVVCESSGKWCNWQVEAPAGKRWAAAGLHALKVEWLRGDRKFEDQAIRDAVERMSCGLEDCDDADCDYCHPEQE
jgi:hypothetical protein